MNPFSLLRVEIIKRPIFNILIIMLAIFWWNLWWAIIWLTLIIRLLLIKSSAAAATMQGSMWALQPKMQEIQEKYADDPQRMSQEMMNLFKTSWWWPLKWCLTMIVQIPVFLWLFFTVRDIALWTISTSVYSFLHTNFSVDFSAINTMFYGIDLLATNNILLTALAAVLMYFQMKFTSMVKPMKAPSLWWMWWANMPDMSKMMWFMNIFFVFMMWAFVWTMPWAIGIYIITTTLFWVLQMCYQYRALLHAKYRARQWNPEIIESTEE
jgi:YidC/Oxa1 family membrane protein insertase